MALMAVDRNRAVGGERFAYRRCRRCATLFLSNVPADLGRFYPQSYYRLPLAQELDDLAVSESHKIDLLSREVAPGRLVEIGAGFGVFARAARNAGFDVTAIEMDRAKRRVPGVGRRRAGDPELRSRVGPRGPPAEPRDRDVALH